MGNFFFWLKKNSASFLAAVEVNRAGACATRNETRAAASARAGVRFVCFFFRWADFVWLLVSIRALGHALIDTHADTERHTHTLPRCRTSLSLARVCQSRAALAARQSLVEGKKKGRSGLALTSLRACHRTLSLVEDCIFRVATTAARATGLAGRGVRFVWSFFFGFRYKPTAAGSRLLLVSFSFCCRCCRRFDRVGANEKKQPRPNRER